VTVQERLSQSPSVPDTQPPAASGTDGSAPAARRSGLRRQRPAPQSEPGRELPTQSRRYGQYAAVAAFLVACALGGRLLAQRLGDTTPVIALSGEVAKGDQVERSDLVSTSVSGVPGAIPVADVDQVVGRYAAVDLLPGQILTTDATTTATVPAAGEMLVGLSLEPTRIPDGLELGDTVRVLVVPPVDTVRVSDLDKPKVLVTDASVYSVQGVSTTGGSQRLTLVVPEDAADTVAAYGAAGQVAVVEAPIGGGGS